MSVQSSTIRVSIGSKPRANGLHHSAADPAAVRPAYSPPIDIHEGTEGLTLEADLPGATEGNLTVQLEENVLSLYVRLDSPAQTDVRLVHEEYRFGDYQRSFILSDEVDRDRITAELTNGVLRVFLPKTDRMRTRRIEIKS